MDVLKPNFKVGDILGHSQYGTRIVIAIHIINGMYFYDVLRTDPDEISAYGKISRFATHTLYNWKVIRHEPNVELLYGR